MKQNAFQFDGYAGDFGEEPDVYEKIIRTRPEVDEETRNKGRKLNHRPKKKKDIEF